MRLLLLSILLFSSFSYAEELTVALPYSGNPPYSFGASEKPRGIYVELLNSLFAKTSYTIKYVYLSNARIRSSFVKGEINIECCPIANWRADEKNISTYSLPFFETIDVYVVKKAPVIPINVNNKTVATIRGYGYKNEENFNRFDVSNEQELLQLIANERVNIGIIDVAIATHYTEQLSLNITLSGIHEKVARPLRIHISKKHIIPEVNQALEKLIVSGKVEQIFAKYR